MSEAPVVALLSSKSSSLLNFRRPLIEAMVAAGYRVVGFGPEREDDVIDGLRAIGAGFDDWPMQRTGLDPRADAASLALLVQKLRRLRPDVVLTYTLKPNIWGSYAARLAGVPRVVSLITGLGYAFMGETPRARAVQIPVAAMLRGALALNDRILVYNTDIEQRFRELHVLGPRSLVELVPGTGVDMEHYARVAPHTDPPTFTLIARLLDAKGIREYAEAAGLVRQTHPHARFLLVGDYDPNPSSLKPADVDAWVAKGWLEYVGPVRDVRPILAQTSVYVLPSWAEGIPRSTLEAMSTGRPIITTDAPGCRETVRDGITGFLVPLRSPQAIAAAMRHFLNDPTRIATMGQAAWQHCRDTYEVGRINQQVLAALAPDARERAVADDSTPGYR